MAGRVRRHTLAIVLALQKGFFSLSEVDSRPVPMFLQQMQKVASAKERERLVFRKFVCVRAVVCGRDQYALVRSLVHNSSIEITDPTHSHGVRVALRLNNDLASAKRVWIENNSIDAAVPARACDLHLTAIP